MKKRLKIVIFHKDNFITFSFYKAVLNNQQIKGPMGCPSKACLRIACCTFLLSREEGRVLSKCHAYRSVIFFLENS